MSTLPPRAVFVTRQSEYAQLLARHGTREQARFFLETRGQSIEAVEARHTQLAATLQTMRAATPSDWRQAHVLREDFDRFLFGPEDIIVAVGQDGLVANIAKYLDGQPVLGVNPDPTLFDGILVRHDAGSASALLPKLANTGVPLERLTMAEARRDDGERLVALNEVFVGHASHQSARYDIAMGMAVETHSSSGLIVATGTGTSGWARSIMESTGTRMKIAPSDRALGFFVREPFPSVATQTEIRSGMIGPDDTLEITSRNNSGGVVFADGIEQDFLEFNWGRRLKIEVSDRHVALA